MKDIAKITGLGLATISKHLNGGRVRPGNRKLIDDAVHRLHFVPNSFACSLKTRQSRTVGVLIPEDMSLLAFDKLDQFGVLYPELTLVKQP